MIDKYDFAKIESKWQDQWLKDTSFSVRAVERAAGSLVMLMKPKKRASGTFYFSRSLPN